MTTYAGILEEYYEQYLRSMRVYDTFAKRTGETSYSLFALLYLIDHQEGAAQKHLKDYLCASKQTVSTIVASLEKRGLIYQRSSQDDARVKNIHLTDLGLTYTEQLRASLRSAEMASIKGISKEELERMNDTHRRLLDALVDHLPEGA